MTSTMKTSVHFQRKRDYEWSTLYQTVDETTLVVNSLYTHIQLVVRLSHT